MQKIWKALSDPTRRKILKLLKEGDMSAGEIAEHFNITKATLSHHLDILKNAELVTFRKDGQRIIYSLNTTVLEDILSFVIDLIEKGGEENENKSP